MSSLGTPRLDGCEFILAGAESLVYGIYLIFFIRTLNVLFERRKRNDGHGCKGLLFAAFLLFFTITAHWILDFARAFEAFVYAQDYIQRGPQEMNATTQYLTQDTPPRYTAISILIVFIVAIADCFMIYRLYIVWNRNLWIIALPAILEAGVIGLGLTVSVLLSRGNGSIPAAAEVWGAATLAVTMLSFFITTNLVAYKVWRSRRTLRSAGAHLTSSTSSYMRSIIISASLYNICALITLILDITGNNVQFVIIALDSPIIGIIFSIVVTGSGRGRRSKSTMSSSELGTEGTTVNQVTSMTSVHIKAVTTTEQFTDANWAARSGTPKVLDQEEV